MELLVVVPAPKVAFPELAEIPPLAVNPVEFPLHIVTEDGATVTALGDGLTVTETAAEVLLQLKAVTTTL